MIYLKKIILILLLVFGLIAIDAIVEGLGAMLIVSLVGLIIGIPIYRFVSSNSTLSQKQVDCDVADLLGYTMCECTELIGDDAIEDAGEFICGFCDN